MKICGKFTSITLTEEQFRAAFPPRQGSFGNPSQQKKAMYFSNPTNKFQEIKERFFAALPGSNLMPDEFWGRVAEIVSTGVDVQDRNVEFGWITEDQVAKLSAIADTKPIFAQKMVCCSTTGTKPPERPQQIERGLENLVGDNVIERLKSE